MADFDSDETATVTVTSADVLVTVEEEAAAAVVVAVQAAPAGSVRPREPMRHPTSFRFRLISCTLHSPSCQ